MNTYKISIDGIAQDTLEPQIILEDGSIRGALYNEDGTGERLESVVFVEPFPFDVDLSILNPPTDATQL